MAKLTYIYLCTHPHTSTHTHILHKYVQRHPYIHIQSKRKKIIVNSRNIDIEKIRLITMYAIHFELNT